jgi:5-methylcytosine-specific restriction endonuclease McrA
VKICSKCKIEKQLTNFSKRSGTKDGLRSCCKDCDRLYAKENIDKIKSYRMSEKNKEKRRLEYKLNHDSFLEYKRNYKIKNKDKIRLVDINWRSLNQEKVNANRMKYIATQLQATPPWLTKEQLKQMQEVYKKALELYKLDGVKRHVDHIIPLKGKTVSGLHVPWNLQILTATENMQKSNKLIGELNGN